MEQEFGGPQNGDADNTCASARRVAKRAASDTFDLQDGSRDHLASVARDASPTLDSHSSNLSSSAATRLQTSAICVTHVTSSTSTSTHTIIGRNFLYRTPSVGQHRTKVLSPTLVELSAQLASRRLEQQRCYMASVVANPDLLRCVSPRFLLSSWVRSIREGTKVSEHRAILNFGASRVSRRLRTFVSHSWRANANLKAIALLLRFNGTPALLCGIVAAILAAVGTATGLLPRWAIDVPNTHFNMWLPNGPDTIDFSGWCSVAYCATYLIVLVWWQDLTNAVRQRMCWQGAGGQADAEGIFLDKLCIHQVDPALKSAGINAIGAYLTMSEEMLLLWDSTYFTRAWCIFEVAVYLSINPEGRVLFLPISLSCAEFAGVFATAFGVFIQVGATMTDSMTPNVQSLSSLGMPNSMMFFTLCFFSLYLPSTVAVYAMRFFNKARNTLLDQLQQLSLRHAESSHDFDKQFVLEAVQDLYGGEAEFEMWAREQLMSYVSKSLGSRLSLPYGVVVRALVPFMALIMDFSLAHLANASTSRRAHYWLGICIQMLLEVPLAILVFQELASKVPELRTKCGNAVVCLALGGVLAAILSVISALLGTCMYAETPEAQWIKCVAAVVSLLGLLPKAFQ